MFNIFLFVYLFLKVLFVCLSFENPCCILVVKGKPVLHWYFLASFYHQNHVLNCSHRPHKNRAPITFVEELILQK